MAGGGAVRGEAVSVPLQPFSWAAAGVGEGQMPNGSTKRKADGSVVPTGEDGCSAKRKVVDPGAVLSKVEKPSDSMAVDGCDEDDWVPAGVDENSDRFVDKELRERPAGVDENGNLIMDDDLLEHLEWLKTFKTIDLRDYPSVRFCSDFSDDESEEEGEEVVQKPNTD